MAESVPKRRVMVEPTQARMTPMQAKAATREPDALPP